MAAALAVVRGFRPVWATAEFLLPELHTAETVHWSHPVSWRLAFPAHPVCYLWAMDRLEAPDMGGGGSKIIKRRCVPHAVRSALLSH